MFQKKYDMYIYMLFAYDEQGSRKLLSQSIMPGDAFTWASKYECGMPEIDNPFCEWVDRVIFNKQ
jgi:hypothetical protein